MPVFRRIQIDAFVHSIAEVPGYGNGPGGEVDAGPFQGTALSAPDTCINQDMNKGLPFKRLLAQTGHDLLDLIGSICRWFFCLYFVLPGLWSLHLVHRIALHHVTHVSHFEKAVQDGV